MPKKTKLTVEVHRVYVFEIEVTAKERRELLKRAEDRDDFTHRIRAGDELGERVYAIDQFAWQKALDGAAESETVENIE